jgi:nucleotide-binding universal stress UspA family protein
MYERLLVAVDHSGASARVLSAAQELAQMSQGEVWVLHVRERESLGRGGVVDMETADEAQETVDAASRPVLVIR